MQRALSLMLRRGALDAYRRAHDDIWPDLVEEIRRCGIGSMEIFADDSQVFIVSEVRHQHAWEELWKTEVHSRWAKLMIELIEFDDDGVVKSSEMTQIFRLETDA